MKFMKAFFALALAAMTTCSQWGFANTLKQLNPSVWTNYSGMDFENLTQEEKTEKLQKLFRDKLIFCKNYNTRRALIRILDPGSFAFFSPDTFSHERDDNFLYWALQLGKYSEVEVLFEPTSFKLTAPRYTDRLVELTKAFFRVESHMPYFENLIEKLMWVSFVNDFSAGLNLQGPIIKGITVHPVGLDEGQVQLVINALDHYKHNTSESYPQNQYSSIRIGAVLGLDQRDLAFANLGRFPLITDIRSSQPNNIGLRLPENFPAEGQDFQAPSWRSKNNAPLLDTVYVNFGDTRLVNPIFQNLNVMKNPSEPDSDAPAILADYLQMNIRGIPFVKGPGRISVARGTNVVVGKETFFRTGTQKHAIGKFLSNNQIEIRPPYTSEVVSKYVSGSPMTNKEMKVSSSFSTTADITNAEYYMSPTPVRWSSTRISNHLASKIYYVFSTEFTPPERKFMGNWHFNNFIDFINKSTKLPKGRPIASGFLNSNLFWGFNGNVPPTNNLVIYDFTTIPNGHPYPECNWNLGNKTHH